jgi:hypothetical protein
MRLISSVEFADQMREPKSRPPGELDLSGYIGVHYPCACGRLHTLDSVDYLVREMNDEVARVVLSCPDRGEDALTLVQLRNGFQTRAISEAGCRLD